MTRLKVNQDGSSQIPTGSLQFIEEPCMNCSADNCLHNFVQDMEAKARAFMKLN